MVDITTALAGIKGMRDFVVWVRSLQKDAETLKRSSEIEHQVGEVYDKLQQLRSENIDLLESNRELAEKLRKADDWKARRDRYKLVKTPGGAHVLQHPGSENEAPHHACPACEQKQLLVPLQDGGTANGVHSCPNCSRGYSVDPVRQHHGPMYSGGQF